MEQFDMILWIGVLLILGYKFTIPLLFSPFILLVSWMAKMKYDRFSQRKNFFEKVLNSIYVRFSIFKDRLCLYWIAQIPSHHVRNFFYKYIYLIKMEKDVVIYAGAEIRNPMGLSIGRGSIIGDNSILDARAGLTIGEDVNFSSNVRIWTLQHDYRDPDFGCNPNHYGPVKVCDKAWIGPHTIILHDVTIGEGAVVAAGAVVTKSVPPYTLVGGVPARVIGQRPQNMRYRFNGVHCMFR